MNYNKDLYQILKIDRNASEKEINSLVLRTSPKDNPEVGKALMVLTEPQKRIEYDNYGWKDEWERDWEKEKDFRNSIFEAIISKIHINTELCYHIDGHRVYVGPEDLDPSLWTPNTGMYAWVNKIWSTRGGNWKAKLEDFKNKMLTAIEKARQEKQKTACLDKCWEYVDGGNCAKCGKTAKLRRKGQYSDGKGYCSTDCYDNNWESRYKNSEYEYKMPKYESPKKYEDLPTKDYLPNNNKNYSPDNHRTPESPLSDKIKQLEKDIEHYKSKKLDKIISENEKIEVQKIIDDLESQLKYEKMKVFFAKKGGNETITEIKVNRFTGEKTTTKKSKSNPIVELLNWMKSEGITQISLNSNGELVIKYGNSTATVDENNLTTEQREIKEFFQACGQTSFNRNELEAAINKEINEDGKGKTQNNNGWVAPVVIGAGAIIIFLIGVVIYQNKKKKGY